MLSSIIFPWYYKAGTYALLASTICGYCYFKGLDHKENEWNASIVDEKIVRTIIIQKQAEILVKYVDRVKVIKEKAAKIDNEVPLYVKKDDVMLPPGFRVFHDAAATDTEPDPSRIASSDPTDAADVATITAKNYAKYYECREQVKALVDWANALKSR